jgi:chemotaxis protein methyltransferase CheR
LTKGIPEEQLSRLSDFIAAMMGLRFPKERWRSLERGVKAAARELGIEESVSGIERLLSSSPTKKQIEILAGHLTIGETYFFRDKRLFKVLQESILSGLIRVRQNQGKHLRIWSAGCSSGEEPYSIAILLSKMIPDLRDWNVTILATDINSLALHKAAAGIYGDWSLRDAEPWVKDGFFNRNNNGRFELLPPIREMVTFSYLNLVDDTYPSLLNNTNALDIIVCRNVLMYFVPELAQKVVRKLHRCLVEGGLLIVSPAESPHNGFSQFTLLRVPGAMLHKKENRDKSSSVASRPLVKQKPGFKPVFDFAPAAPVIKSAELHVAPRSETHGAPPGLRISKEEIQKKEEAQKCKDLYREASELYEKGCYPEAAAKSEELLSRNPSDANALTLLARIYANWGKLDRAFSWCEKAISVDKLHAGYRYLMAAILQELGRTEEAIASLKKTLYLDPKFIAAHVALGNISLRSGNRKESAKHFRHALTLLSSRPPEEVLPESEGINAERLTEIIKAIQGN